MEAEERLVLHVLRGQNLTSLSGLRSHRQGNGEGESTVLQTHTGRRGDGRLDATAVPWLQNETRYLLTGWALGTRTV